MHQRAFSDRTSLQKRSHDSSIPLEHFCHKHGISPWTYYYWKKKLGFQDTAQRKLQLGRKAFLPVSLSPLRDAAGFTEIRFREGTSIRFPCGFDKELFRAIIEVLSSARPS
jgi:hypothetical protein